MTTKTELSKWLDSPGGQAYAAANGGRQQAMQILVNQSLSVVQDAADYNRERVRNGLPPVSEDVAQLIAGPMAGVTLSGDADEIKHSFRWPDYRIVVGSDTAADAPVLWEPRSLAMINVVRERRGLEPLE